MVVTTSPPGSPPEERRFGSMIDVMRRSQGQLVNTPPPTLRRRRTVATTEAPGSPPEPLRYGSIAEIMRRTRPIDTPPPVNAPPAVNPSPPVNAPPPVARARQEELVCWECGSGEREEELLLCSLCDQCRHTYCLRPVLAAVPLGPWRCPDCVPPPVAHAQQEELVCWECGSGERDEKLLLCGLCDQVRHTYCLTPTLAAVPLVPWLCPDCLTPPSRTIIRFPPDESKIIEFFGIQTGADDLQPEIRRLYQDATRRKSSLFVTHKKKRKMLPFVPVEDRVQRLRQMASLASALISSNMDFSDELTYMPNMAPRSSNEAKLEEGPAVQVLSKEDKETIELCKSLQKRGECAPLVVVFDSCEGFTVQADADIKDMTFIAELTGDVDYWENREHDDCNSITTLLWTADPSKKLVICSDKRGNIGRFLSGINNHIPDGKKKQNVKSVRYDIDGECHVLLVACRDIAQGEKLSFDYNEDEYAYPTHHFI